MAEMFDPNALNGTLPEGLLQPMQDLGSLSGTMANAEKDKKVEPIKLRTQSDGTWVAEGGSHEDLKQVMDALRFKQEAMVAMQNQEAMRLLDQENKLRANPAMNVISTLAAQMAQAKDMPGWVQAAGRASQALNPTPDMLQQKRMGIQEQIGQGLQQQAGMALKQWEMQTHADALKNAQLKADASAAERIQTNWEQVKNKATDIAKSLGSAPPEMKEEFMREAAAIGKKPAEIESAWKSVERIASAKIEKDKRDEQTAVTKAQEIAKATAPIKIQVGETLQDHASKNRREEMQLRKDVQRELLGDRQDAIRKRQLDVMTARMDASRLTQMATINPREYKELENGRDMEQFASHMMSLFGPGGKLENYQGRWQGILTQKLPSALSSEERQTAQHMFGVERKRIIDWAKAGVMGWRPSEDFIMKLGMIETLDKQSRQAIFKEINNQINLGRRSITEAKRFAPWDMLPELLGGPNSPVYKEAAPRAAQFFDKVDAFKERRNPSEGGTPPVAKYPWEK